MIGRFGGSPLVERLARAPARAAVLARARALVDRRGGVGVFLSTWAVAPLGPWVNFIAGATGLTWVRFTVADIVGEVIWVTLYTGLGQVFASNIALVADAMSDIVGLVVALVVAVAAALWIRAVLRAQKARGPRPAPTAAEAG
jgi:membrane protein DedA with SNARE-associated domain